jgi:5-oxoprolinase (ATP-hydrolysing) subunit A
MNKPNSLEINCDLGEGIPYEEKIFPWIDAASIACGGHYGDEKSIRHSLLLAKQNAVKVGIHPSYPDRENFGRKSLNIPFDQLEESLLVQIRLFQSISTELGMEADHIKFHGALYNDSAKNNSLAEQLTGFLKRNVPDLCVLVPPLSEMEKVAKSVGLKTKLEVFGDRTYKDNYLLLERDQPKALLTDLEDIEVHISSILKEKTLISSSGKKLPIHANTLCIHGDNPGILNFLPSIRLKFWNK